MTDKKYIASYLVDTGASKQNIQEVQDALVKSGDAGVRSASQITQGLERIEGSSEKALGRLAQGEEVSEAQLRKLAGSFDAVYEAVTRAFGSMEQAPQEIQAAMQIAVGQITAVNETFTTTGERVDRVAEQFAALGEAAATASDQMGAAAEEASSVVTAGAEAASTAMSGEAESTTAAAEATADLAATATKAADAAQYLAAGARDTAAGFSVLETRVAAVQAVIDGYYAAIEDGEAPSRMVVRKLTIQYEALKQSIIDTFGSIEAATPEAIAAYNELGVQVEQLIEQQGRYTLAVNIANNQVKLASGQAIGAEKAFAAMAGSMGGVVVQGFLVASMAGIAIAGLNKLSDALQYDEKSGNSFKEKATEVLGVLGSIKRDAYDAGAAAIQFGYDISLLTGETAKAKTSSVELEHSFENLALSIFGIKESAAANRVEQEAGLPVLERVKTTVDEAKTVSDFYNLTLSRGALGQKEWAAAVKESGGTLEGLLEAIKKHIALMPADTEALRKITEAEQEVEREHKKTVESIQQEIDAIDKHVESIKRLVTAAGTLEDAQKRHLDLSGKELGLLATLEVAHNGTTKSIDDLLKVIKEQLKYGELKSQELQTESGLLRTMIGNTTNLTDAERARNVAMAESIKLVAEASAKQKELRTQLNAELDGLDVLKGASQQELDARVNKIHKLEDEIIQTNAAGAAQKAQIAIQEQQAAATKVVSDATVIATGNFRAGTGAVMNTGEAYEKAKAAAKDSTDAILDAAEAAAKSGDGFDSATVKVKAAKDEFTGFSVAADSVKEESEKLHYSQLASLAADFENIAGAVKSGLTQSLKDANEELRKLIENANKSVDAINALANAGKGGESHQYSSPIGPGMAPTLGHGSPSGV